MDALRVTLMIGIGAVTGASMGLVGMGGGVLLTVLLQLLAGLSIPQATAVALFLQLVPQTAVAVYMYHHKGYLNFGDALYVAVGSFIGVTAGTWLVTRGTINDKQLTLVFALVLLLCSTVYLVKWWCHP